MEKLKVDTCDDIEREIPNLAITILYCTQYLIRGNKLS